MVDFFKTARASIPKMTEDYMLLQRHGHEPGDFKNETHSQEANVIARDDVEKSKH